MGFGIWTNLINNRHHIHNTLNEKPADDRLVKDVEMLLGLKVGNKHVLEQVLRAATNGELVSNHERTYVDSLIEKHKGIVDTTPTQPARRQAPKEEPAETSSKSSSKTIAVGAGAAVAVVAIVVALLALPAPMNGTPADTAESVLTIGVDSEEYSVGDFILVEGLSTGASVSVDIQIVGPSGQVWHESIVPNADGYFSTIALAGSGGWSPGSYTIRATNGDQVYESAFDYMDS